MARNAAKTAKRQLKQMDNLASLPSMNVVKKELRLQKYQPKHKNELVRKDTTFGIRGSTIPVMSFNTGRRQASASTPRYTFTRSSAVPRQTRMGPPTASPRSLKRKITHSSSTRPESLSSDQRYHNILASDSAAGSAQTVTPRNRPTALRYISSSSRGGYSGTRSARSTSTSFVEPSVILAISEGRGMARGEIGMAALDLQQPRLLLCQFSDTLLYTHTLTKINYFNPVEIIVPHTFCEGGSASQLWHLLRKQRPQDTVTAVQRRHFNDEAARQQIQALVAPQYAAVCLQVLHKFYALTAAAAVLKYVEYIQCIVFAKESLKIEYHSSENTMIIDSATATQLELVQPLVPSAGPTCCLLGVLGPTYTVGGIRALRASLLQPSCKRTFIETRQDAVQELIENDTGLVVDLQNILKKLSEVDRILFLCIETPNTNMYKFGEAQITQTLLLKTTMELVPSLVEALNDVESALLRKIKTDLENPNYKEIAERVRSVIQDDAHHERGAMGSLQRCFAVKPNINGFLDVARRMYSELIEDIEKMVEYLSETHDLPLRLNQNVMKGFHIVMPVAPKNRRQFSVEDLPPVFIKVVFNGASVAMSTEELVVLDHQAKEALNEIQKMTNVVISTLLKDLRPFMSSLYKLCENVAEIDTLLALAQASSIGSYIRPDFNSYLEIRNSVHPLLDYNSKVNPVPNDIFASPEYNFTIITGPNMGGKSIYIKQIAILQIMAQIGCFVPATSAVFRLCDRMFSRVGFNDSVELNASTYVLEMKEINHILQGLTPTSLVIIDELCRGTSVEEGTSVAWAICEELLASDAFTFFTTHFMYLTRLQELYFNVLNRHAVVSEEIDDTRNNQKRLIYQHKIEPGTTKIEHYGLALAAITSLPEDTVNFAKELSELINENRHIQHIETSQRTDEALLYKLNADIQQEKRKLSSADPTQIQKIIQFKRENPELMERLHAEKNESTKSAQIDKSSDGGNNSKQETTYDVIDDSITNVTEAKITIQKSPTRNFSKVTQFTDETAAANYIPSPIDNSNLDDFDHQFGEHNEIYTSVAYSNELLNTVSVGQLSQEQKRLGLSPNIDVENNVMPNTQSNKSTSIDDRNYDISQIKSHHDIEIHSDDSNHSIGEASTYLESVRFNNNEENVVDLNASSSTDSSDIADEITQIIGSDKESVKSKAISLNVSLDEEFISETVNEINDEIVVASMDHLILTPPSGFQD